jgi:hypothetical protein
MDHWLMLKMEDWERRYTSELMRLPFASSKNPSSRVPGIRFERSSIRMSGIFAAQFMARFSHSGP